MHASLSEDGILGLLARHFPATHPSLLLGRGVPVGVSAGQRSM